MPDPDDKTGSTPEDISMGASHVGDTNPAEEEEIEEIEDWDVRERGFPPPPFRRPPFPPPFGRPQFPPPFGRPPFPPPPWGIPREPPVEYEYEEETYVSDSDEASNDYMEESSYSPTSESAPPPLEFKRNPKSFGKSINAMRSVEAERIREIGAKAAEANKESVVGHYLMTAFKIFGTFVVIFLLVVMCVMMILWYNGQIVKKAEEARKVEAETSTILGDYIWKMGSGAGALCVRAFYEAKGDLSVITEAKDILARGTIEIEGKKTDFYSIKKLDGRTFVKIGEGSKAKTYLIGGFQDGVIKLVDGGMMGKKIQLPKNEALVIRAIGWVDDLLFLRAFANKDEEFTKFSSSYAEYQGRSDFNGFQCESVNLYEDDCKIQFFFESSNHLLKGAVYATPNQNIKIMYDRYVEFEKGFRAPSTRIVYVEGKPYATINIDFIARNSGIFFPR